MIVDHPHSLASDLSRSSLNSAARSRAGVRAWRRGWLLLLAGCAVALQGQRVWVFISDAAAWVQAGSVLDRVAAALL